MALLVELSGEQPKMASAEAWSTASSLGGRGAEVLSLDGPVLVIDVPGLSAADLAARLGLAHRVSDQATSGPAEGAAALAASVDIGVAQSFRVRVRVSDASSWEGDPRALEAEAGGLLQERTRARVDLASPEAEVRLVLAEGAHAGLLGGSVDRSAMEGRAVRHRPFSHPISLHPKYARAMVNLARVPVGGRVADPFCGTGGILIEAALMGLSAWGGDLDPRMVEGSRRNLESLDLAADLEEADVGDMARAVGEGADAVVTDPPYGRSTRTLGGGTEGVLERLFAASADVLPEGGRLVVCLPSRDLLPGDGRPFEVEAVHPMRVHKSLTRHVCVLKR
jgi:tRNA (guanine10-N2)-dimethyltransferase